MLYHEDLADALLGGAEQLGCAPSEIRVRDDSMSALLEPLAKALGARLTVGDLPTIRWTKREFDKMLMSRGARRQQLEVKREFGPTFPPKNWAN